MSLTTTPGYVRCAMPFGANDHCDFAAMHATIHHLIYLYRRQFRNNIWRSSLILISTLMNYEYIGNRKIPAKEILLWVKERTFQKNALPFKGKARNYR